MVKSRQIESGRKGFMGLRRKGQLVYSEECGVRNMGNPVSFPISGMGATCSEVGNRRQTQRICRKNKGQGHYSAELSA